jgi:ATP-dependent Clp protease adaptor protein ClpS
MALLAPAKPGLSESAETRTRLAPQWRVICHNDDVTTFEHVVRNFVANFDMTFAQARERMLEVHRTGAALCGVYPLENAEFRVVRATAMARAEGFPLSFSLESEEPSGRC